MDVRDGAVFFSNKTDGTNHVFHLHVQENNDRGGWRSYNLAASLIFSNGEWHQLSKNFPDITGESKTYFHAPDFWPIDDDGNRMEGKVDTNLISVALRDANKLSTPYTSGDPLDEWKVITCGEGLAQLIWFHAPSNQAALLFESSSTVRTRYPSLFGKSRTDIQERDRRRKNVSSRLDAMAKKYPPIEIPLLDEFNAATEPLNAYQGQLPLKIKTINSFVRNTRLRAAVKGIDVFDWWLNGYQKDAPSDDALYKAYVDSVEGEINRSRENIVNLEKTTVSRLVQMASAVADLGPLISKDIARSRYKISNAKLNAGKKDGSLRGAMLQGKWHWVQDDIRKISGTTHLTIQPPEAIPKIIDLKSCYSVCSDLVKRFDSTCQVDIDVSFFYKYGRELPPVNKRWIQNEQGLFKRYYAHDIFAWFDSNPSRRMAAVAQQHVGLTSKTRKVTQQKKLTPIAPSRPRSAGLLTIMTSSKECHGYHDFLSEVDLNEVPHEVVALGFRENAILTHLEQRTYKAGDIICIVRGGGDLLHPSFKPFDHFDSAIRLKGLAAQGIIVVTGIGHSRDSFVVDRGATFVESTPVKAGQRVRQLLHLT